MGYGAAFILKTGLPCPGGRRGCTLLLDEPFTGMDPAAVQASIALLRERVEGRPVLLATHDRAAIDALGWPMLELQKLAQPGAACNSTNKGLQ